MIIYERVYPVNVFETDIRGTLSLVSLFDMFQDIAGRNASQLGFGREHLMTNRNIWVLSRIAVRIKKMPQSWDEIAVRTWPCGTDGIFAVRDYEASSLTGEMLVSATSSWVVIDYDTRHLQRPGKALSDLNIEFPDKRSMEGNSIKINSLPAGDNTTAEYRAALSDLDINQHVNNAMYIRWVYNTYTKEFVDTHSPVSADVNYLNEGHFGDDVIITTAPDPDEKNTFYHSVTRKDTNIELCRIRLNWQEDNN